MLLLITETVKVERKIDLRSIPPNKWPDDLKKFITPKDVSDARNTLFPRDYLASKVEERYKLQISFTFNDL